MPYRWNNPIFGRNVGDVETESEIKRCPVDMDTLLAAGNIEKVKEEKGHGNKDGQTTKRP